MKKVRKRILIWITGFFLGMIALLLLLVLLFYLFRGKITERAVDYINEMQPGEVIVEKMNLKPFLDFPNVSLRLQDLQYFAPGGPGLENDTLPVLKFNDTFISMDVVQLIKGTYLISEVTLADGIVNYRMGKDSVSNFENALGIVFGSEGVTDTLSKDETPVRLDLKRLGIQNLIVNYEDQPANNSFSIQVNGLESGFSYSPDQVTASVVLQSEIQRAHMKDLTLDRPRSLSFSSAMHYDQQRQNVSVGTSTLNLKDASFELEGEVDLASRTVDLDFSAVNSGIELLNFLLSGVLDLDAIEQIGNGSIRLEGNVSGSYSKHIPLVTVKVLAEDMAFQIPSIRQSVTGIAFDGSITNGSSQDFSDAEVHLNNFQVDFPRGSLLANIDLYNLQQPYAEITLTGDADLSVINEIITTETIKDMQGNIRFEGSIVGSADKQTGNFLDSAGLLKIQMDDVGFSLPDNEVQHLSGELLVKESQIGLRDMEVVVDSNKIQWRGEINNLLPWLLEFDTDPAAKLEFSARELYPGKLLKEPALIRPIRDLGFRLSICTDGQVLRRALAEKSIPPMELTLEDLAMTLPGYAPVSEGRMNVYLEADTAGIRDLHARIGESAFDLDAALVHVDRLVQKDSSANLLFTFDLSADRLLARDLLTIDEEFSFLPPQFAVEEIHDFKLKGKVETKVHEILKDSLLPDFRFASDEMHWRFSEYPNTFNDIVMDIERRDSLLVVHRFSGSIGESNMNITASVANLLDSARTITGKVDIRSELLDLDQLMDYPLLVGSGEQEVQAASMPADTLSNAPPDLSKIDLPDLVLEVDVGELRYADNLLKNLDGRLTTKPYKIFYFDHFSVQSEGGGSMLIDGQFNVSDPSLYMLSANIDIDTVNMADFNLQIAIGDSLYSLEDNFNGLMSADGLAEFFLNPDFSINTDYSTAMFNVLLENGRVRHFTPLRALARYTGNKDLDNVKFGLLRNSFTLINGAVQVPLMRIESTIGLILLEGEQYLDGDFLYLARLPVSLVRGSAWNVLTNQQNRKPAEDEELQVRPEKQKFLVLTISGKEGAEEVKLGDKRDLFR